MQTCPRTARRSRSTCARASIWSDGVPFTSADAEWTFNAVLDNKTNQLHTTISAVKSVSAPDADTLVLHLTTRDSEFLEKLALPMLPKHVWSKIPIAKLDKVSGPIPTVTTAPWMLTEWHKNATTIMVRNPKYDLSRNGGKEPAVKRILMTTYQNPDSVYRDVAQGNLDVAFNGPVDWTARAKKDTSLSLVSAPRGGYWEIAFNSCPPDGIADLQRPCQGRQGEGRPGSRDPQGARLRHRPRAVRAGDLRRPGLDRVRADLAALQALLAGPLEGPEVRLQLRPREGEADPQGRGLGLLDDAVHEERREGRVRARHALRQQALPADGRARRRRRARRSAS